MKVVNLFAGPGVGKTTTGQLLAGMLSMTGHRVELVPEFAKFATYAKYNAALGDQDYMFAKQHHRLAVLRADTRLEYVIMDGPLPIALTYADPSDTVYTSLVLKRFFAFDNINIFLERNPAYPYEQMGRSQSHSEAQAQCDRTLALMQDNGIEYETLMVNEVTACTVFERLTGRLSPLVPRAKN